MTVANTPMDTSANLNNRARVFKHSHHFSACVSPKAQYKYRVRFTLISVMYSSLPNEHLIPVLVCTVRARLSAQ